MLCHRVLQHYESGYRVSVFLPILYAMTFIATIHIIFTDYQPIPFESIGSPEYVYRLWCYLGIGSPLLFFVSWIMIRLKCRRTTYPGLWLMLGANVSQLFYLLSFHLAISLEKYHPMSDARIMQQYLMTSVLLYLLALIVKDIAWLVTTEREAIRIYRNARK